MHSRSARTRSFGAALLILCLVSPAGAAGGAPVANAAVSARHPLTNAVSANAQGDQSTPVVASSPNSSLVVWSEARAETTAIMGARVGPSGTLLDPQAILIAQSDFFFPVSPAVAWNGSRFLVMFAVSTARQSLGVQGRFVSTAGVVSVCECDPNPGGLGSAANVALASNGSGFLVTWDDGFFRNVHGARISATGQSLDGEGFVISSGATDPAVAYDGSRYLVAWTDLRAGTSNPDIVAARVTNGGAVQDPSGKLVSGAPGEQSAATVAGRPGGFLVAWQDRRGASFDIRAARVSDAGAVADPSGLPVSIAAGAQTSPTAGWNGTRFLVAWTDGRTTPTNIRGARVATTGAVLEPSGFVVSGAVGAQTAPGVSSGATALVAWVDGRRSTDLDIFGARVSGTTVSPAAGLLISRGPAPQRCSDIAFDGTDYFVVWQERHGIGDDFDIFGARISPAGVMRDPDGIAISTASGAQTCPSVAWNGTRFYVAWTDHRAGGAGDIFGTAVSAAGTVTSPQGIDLASATAAETAVDVTANATAFLVAWQDHASGSGNILGTRLSPTGAPIDVPALALSAAAGAQVTPALTANTNGFLATWADARTGDFDIRATRLANTGPVLDPTGRLVAGGDGDQSRPAVDWNQTAKRFLVAYRGLGDRNRPALLATRLTGGAVALDPDGIFLYDDQFFFRDIQSTAVAWNGSEFVVVAEQDRCDDLDHCETSSSVAIGVLVTAAGAAEAPFDIVVADPTEDLQPAAERGPGNQVGISYAELPTPYRGSERVFLRTVAP